MYSTRCNPSVVEMLLKKVKNNAHLISQSKVFYKQAAPVKKNECTKITAKVHVNRGINSRSYAQVVRECAPKSVIQSGNMIGQGIGINYNSLGTHLGKQGCQDSVKHSDLSVAPCEGIRQQSKHSQLTSPACRETFRDGGIVVTCDEASYTVPCIGDSLTHIEAFRSDRSPRSPANCENSLGQTQTTANMCDLAEPLTSGARGQDTAAPVHNEVVQPKQYDEALDGVLI